ncbi:hypothetical protein [Deinococcus arenicola]|uniref:Lipoprotein n=1 Tax=Deinococcus arenicola TaxID=2994950 RepID=A0ABU4DP01_9DEIO|nr:hypothetical protein [Deinococcus sp. ZS9-10]MDV6374162.1 hypothetical protein [Deinococcus sp. ZS9-10]
MKRTWQALGLAVLLVGCSARQDTSFAGIPGEVEWPRPLSDEEIELELANAGTEQAAPELSPVAARPIRTPIPVAPARTQAAAPARNPAPTELSDPLPEETGAQTVRYEGQDIAPEMALRRSALGGGMPDVIPGATDPQDDFDYSQTENPQLTAQQGNIWAAARTTPNSCGPVRCLGFTTVPPEVLRAKLGAPAWTQRLTSYSETEYLTEYGDWALEMSESSGNYWALRVKAAQ